MTERFLIGVLTFPAPALSLSDWMNPSGEADAPPWAEVEAIASVTAAAAAWRQEQR